jgi:hypothetical protein
MLVTATETLSPAAIVLGTVIVAEAVPPSGTTGATGVAPLAEG